MNASSLSELAYDQLRERLQGTHVPALDDSMVRRENSGSDDLVTIEALLRRVLAGARIDITISLAL